MVNLFSGRAAPCAEERVLEKPAQAWRRAPPGIYGVMWVNSTETLLEPLLATARSCIPSPAKSPTPTENGCVPTTQSGVVAGGRG